MKRSDLSRTIRETLKRLPPPYDSHYGIVPPAPPEDGVFAPGAAKALEAAQAAFGTVNAILTRREAVSSSSIEGTQSTLDELLSVEETGDDGARNEARQVCSYAVALDRFVPRATELGYGVFTIDRSRISIARDEGRPGLSGRSRRLPNARSLDRREQRHRIFKYKSSTPTRRARLPRSGGRLPPERGHAADDSRVHHAHGHCARPFRSGTPLSRRQRSRGSSPPPAHDGGGEACTAVPFSLHRKQEGHVLRIPQERPAAARLGADHHVHGRRRDRHR